MPYYESVFIARQDVSASAAEALADKFADLLKTNGGTVAKREYWGLRPLAYRIKKNKKGHYFLFNLEAPPQAVQEMERNMRLNEDILRYLTLGIDEIDEAPSVMMQNRGRRDEENGDRRPSSSPRPAPREASSSTPDESPDKPQDETKAEESSEGGEEAPKKKTAPESSEESAAKNEDNEDAGDNEDTKDAAEETATEESNGQDESGEDAS
ncbi:MAG: 30S ribosomal protein S6 [Alphaproteobacteria bacterium]|nr:30S ribosomal protein S6 [Alphaproteobacteria bacterium]